MTLKELEIGKSAVIKVVGGEAGIKTTFFRYGSNTGGRGNRY